MLRYWCRCGYYADDAVEFNDHRRLKDSCGVTIVVRPEVGGEQDVERPRRAAAGWN